LAIWPLPRAMAAAYTTNFPLTENPISEGGNWINGQTVGLDWSNVATTNHMAICTVDDTHNPTYNDSTAVLTGPWGPDQTVTATLYITNQAANGWPEAELRLRSSISAHKCTGYEVVYSLRNDSSCYIAIARWNGAYGDFTHLTGVGYPNEDGTPYVATNGSILKASISGSTITVYLNGIQVIQHTDTNFVSGSPGIGFDIDPSNTDQNGTFGFTSFAATDDPPITMVPTFSNGLFNISFPTVAGQNYFILQFTNLQAANHGTYTIVNGTGAPYNFIWPVTNGRSGSFFRLLVP